MNRAKLLLSTLLISAVGIVPLLSSEEADASDWYYVFCVKGDGRWDWLKGDYVSDDMKDHGANVYRDTAYYYGKWKGNQWWPLGWGNSTHCREVELACTHQMGTPAQAQIASGSRNQYWRQLGNCGYYKVSD